MIGSRHAWAITRGSGDHGLAPPLGRVLFSEQASPLFAVPEVDQRAIVMVAFGVIMQTTFSFTGVTYFGRRSALKQTGVQSGVQMDGARE